MLPLLLSSLHKPDHLGRSFSTYILYSYKLRQKKTTLLPLKDKNGIELKRSPQLMINIKWCLCVLKKKNQSLTIWYFLLSPLTQNLRVSVLERNATNARTKHLNHSMIRKEKIQHSDQERVVWSQTALIKSWFRYLLPILS